MRTTYNKLVRDRIPEIIQASGKMCSTEILSDEEYQKQVDAKLDISIHVPREGHDSKHAQFLRANLRKSYNYPFERDALHAKNACKLINASS